MFLINFNLLPSCMRVSKTGKDFFLYHKKDATDWQPKNLLPTQHLGQTHLRQHSNRAG